MNLYLYLYIRNDQDLFFEEVINPFKDEYCIHETFKASCSNNEVVVINDAKYGRMSVGKYGKIF